MAAPCGQTPGRPWRARRRRRGRRPALLAAGWVLSDCRASGAAAAPGDLPCDLPHLEASGRGLDAAGLQALTRPTVLPGLAREWPASPVWSSAEAFAARFGRVAGYARDHDQLELRDAELTVEAYLQLPEGAASFSIGGVNLSSSAAFFVNDYEDGRLLGELRPEYEPVPEPLRQVGALRVFSLERLGAGVALHRHEAAWQALLAGRKTWFLLAPSIEAVPQHGPCAFLTEGPPPLAETCTLEAGEVLYVPAGWWHATCTVSEEPSLAIGGVGSIAGWPPELVAAREGRVEGAAAVSPDALALAEGEPGGVFVGGERPLFVAAAFGRLPAVQALLANGADANIPRRDGRTALHEAARRGDMDILQALLVSGANVSQEDASGSLALHHAASERGGAAIPELLRRGVLADAEARRGDGRTPLHVACRSHASPVRAMRALLVEAALQPSRRDHDGITPLMLCAATGHGQGVGLLLRMGGLEAALAQDVAGRDALDHALAGRGDEGVVHRLLAAGLSPASRLPAAARLGETALLPVLVAAGASTGGAVLEAARAGHARAVEALVGELGGDPSELDSDRATPLHVAALAGHLGAVKALLALGGSASAADLDGLTPAHYAATTLAAARLPRRKAILEALAQAGGPQVWRVASKAGATPLHLAAAAGDEDIVQWAVDELRVADPGARDGTGATPADAAEQAGHKRLAQRLRAWAGRPTLPTPADEAEL